MAQALAWHALREKIPCTVVVPDSAPQTKLDAIRRYRAEIVQVPWDEVWKIATNHLYPPLKDRIFVHPFADPGMIAGNGTIGLEIMEDLPEVDAVVVPFGGGGLFTGIASAIRGRSASVRIYASEVATAAPVFASLKAGAPKEVNRIPSFVDGIGSRNVLEEMWSLVKPLIEGSIVVSLADVASAIKLLVERNRVVAEGAGASSVAAGLTGKAGNGKVVCVVSGGNIDSSNLTKILGGQIP